MNLEEAMPLPQEARPPFQEAMPLPEKPMKLHIGKISSPQSFDTFSTILDYTSSSGSKFQLTEIINNRTTKTYAYLDTMMLLPEDERSRQMIQGSICKNIPGIESIRFLSKYKLLIEKGRIFDWEKIGMQVIEVLEKTLEQKEKSGEC